MRFLAHEFFFQMQKQGTDLMSLSGSLCPVEFRSKQADRPNSVFDSPVVAGGERQWCMSYNPSAVVIKNVSTT